MLRLLQVALNGRFAFVEFRVPEYATAALQLNGQIALMGNTLKIARPASYVEMPVGATFIYLRFRRCCWVLLLEYRSREERLWLHSANVSLHTFADLNTFNNRSQQLRCVWSNAGQAVMQLASANLGTPPSPPLPSPALHTMLPGNLRPNLVKLCTVMF
jgi:hypothetical protein